MHGQLARRLRKHLGLAEPERVAFRTDDPRPGDGFARQLLEYTGREGDRISAFLFTPTSVPPLGGVVVFHQHASQFHLGKSEVAGDAGDPLQAFGPALARAGFVVLSPDALTFEDRRRHTTGIEPHEGDWLQHYNAMADRLVDGDLLMRKGLDDAQRALSVLLQVADDETLSIGVLGHSFGGLVALYLAAVDTRSSFACVSGALASFSRRRERGTGLNMFEVVPGLRRLLGTHDLVAAIAPRPLLVVSATDDPYAIDADEVVRRVQSVHVSELRVRGGHRLDAERFDGIVDWITRQGREDRAGA